MSGNDNQINSSKKRSLDHMMANELQGRLQSKQDFYTYLDKQ